MHSKEQVSASNYPSSCRVLKIEARKFSSVVRKDKELITGCQLKTFILSLSFSIESFFIFYKFLMTLQLSNSKKELKTNCSTFILSLIDCVFPVS